MRPAFTMLILVLATTTALTAARFQIGLQEQDSACFSPNNGISFPNPFEEQLSCPNSFLKSRPDYSSLGAYVDGTNLNASPGGAYVAARMLDELTVTGGVGPGVLRVTFNLDGTITTTGPGALGGADFLGQIDSVFSVIQCLATCSESDTIDVPFTYGVPFFVDLRLNLVLTGGTGTVDFFSSADLAPFQILDTSLQPTSGGFVTSSTFNYPVAGPAAIPEPRTFVLVAIALAGAACRRKWHW